MIRELTQDDLSQTFFDLFAEVECGNHFDPSNPRHVSWLRNRMAVQFARGTRFFGLFAPSGEPLGFLGLLAEGRLEGAEHLGPLAEILDLGVVREHRRVGHGAELLAHAEALAGAASAPYLFVATYAADYAVIAFYGKNGYAPVAVLPGVNGPHDEGDLIMRKTLRGPD